MNDSIMNRSIIILINLKALAYGTTENLKIRNIGWTHLSNINTYIPSHIWSILVAHSMLKYLRIVEIDKMFLILSCTDRNLNRSNILSCS